MAWFNKNCVLVIEDDQDVSKLIQVCLIELGKYNVISAEDGNSGIRLANEHKPDLILLDWMLPDIDGLKVLSSLKRENETSKIPVIMLTSKKEMGYVEAAISNGAVDYLQKPLQPDEMVRRVKLHI